MSAWALGTCDKHFSLFFMYYKLNDYNLIEKKDQQIDLSYQWQINQKITITKIYWSKDYTFLY